MGSLTMDEFREGMLADLREGAHSNNALWYLNIKKFRFINESYGYSVGDEILSEFEAYLKRRISSRGMVTRIGDDRFAAFISQEFYESDEATSAFEQMYREFNLQLANRGIDQPIEIAAGVYFLTPDDISDPDIDHIIDQANSAHKRAREQGGNHVIFYDYEFAEKQRRENAIEHDLTSSIAAGEIEVWMQPLLDFVKGEVVASEALARWNHARLGRLSPAEFIPVLERAGKIGELDRHIWNVACYEAHNRQIETGEPPVPFSVNVSRAEVLDPELPDYLSGLREKYELPKDTLRLEVTESAYTEQPDELIRAVTCLRDRGFIVEMDDFGSGYSSLNMLRNLPVDILKLDMGFLRHEKSDSSDAVILNSVIRMAHGLDIPIIAEGVETIEQAEMLKTMGCRLMQGYFFAKPMPIEQFYKLLKDTKTAKHTYVPEHTGDRMAQLLDQRGDTAFFFNHCVGPAFIYSASTERYDVLLANDDLYAEFQIDPESVNVFNVDLLSLMDVEGREAFRRASRKADDIGHARCVVKLAKSGRWMEGTIRSVSSTETAGVLVCYVRDATEDSELSELSAVMGRGHGEADAHDALTGLLSYHALDALVMGELGKDGGTLVLADIDDFDLFVDKNGQEAANVLVDHVANQMRMRLSKDTLLARCGEGLFAAFLPRTHTTVDARANACAIVDALRTTATRFGHTATCSLGLASIDKGIAVDTAIMYRRALRALTIAKINGGDGFLLYNTVRGEVENPIEVFAVPLRHAPDGEMLPAKALDGEGLFEIISRDFEEHHAWNLPPNGKRSVRDTVFGALRYRSMAEVPGILSFDYDPVDDVIFLESVGEDGKILQRAIGSFSEALFTFGDKVAEESMARLSSLLADMEYMPASGNVDLKCRLFSDESFRWYRFSFTSLRDDKSFVIRGLGYGEDIDLSRESGMWWKDRAMHDGLTGLLNREGLEDAVDMMLAKRDGGMMFVVNVDDFRGINDQMGHLSGDSVLCEVADTLLATFREHDVVGRFGADEMIAFISGYTEHELARKRSKALVDMARDISIGEYGQISVCVGTSVIEGKASFYDFLERADHALHIAKAKGGGQFVVADEADESVKVHRMATSTRSTRSAHGKETMAIEAKWNRERTQR